MISKHNTEQFPLVPARHRRRGLAIWTFCFPLFTLPGATMAASTSAAAYTVAFNPTPITLANPINPGQQGKASSVSLTPTVYDQNGTRIEPSPSRPLEIRLYGAPSGVITASVAQLTGPGAVTISYNGGYFANPVTIEAHLKLSDAPARYAIGTTQILPAKPVTRRGTTSFDIPYWCDTRADPRCAGSVLQSPLKVQAAVGYDTATAANFGQFGLDTGSLGVIVPEAELGPDAIGPAGPGSISYDSSGNSFSGNYYLAPITVSATQGGVPTVMQTFPVMVLAINKAYCAQGYPQCEKNPPQPTLRYLGIGFDRNSTVSGDQFNSPAYNAFLQISTAANGSDINPGYILTKTGATVGITNTKAKGFKFAKLKPNTTTPGDWKSMPGCFAFPQASSPNTFCRSNLLLDIGISEMFIDLLPRLRPAQAVDPKDSHTVAPGTLISVLVGTNSNPAMKYRFNYQPNAPTGPAPSSITWIDPPTPGFRFVNTGRNVLNRFSYLYDARHGRVGFKPAR